MRDCVVHAWKSERAGPELGACRRTRGRNRSTRNTHAHLPAACSDQCLSGERDGCGGMQPTVLAAVERGCL